MLVSVSWMRPLEADLVLVSTEQNVESAIVVQDLAQEALGFVVLLPLRILTKASARRFWQSTFFQEHSVINVKNKKFKLGFHKLEVGP